MLPGALYHAIACGDEEGGQGRGRGFTRGEAEAHGEQQQRQRRPARVLCAAAHYTTQHSHGRRPISTLDTAYFLQKTEHLIKPSASLSASVLCIDTRTMKLMLVAKSTCDLTPRRISISHVADGPRVEGRGRGRVGGTGQSAAGAVVQGAVLRGSIRRLPPGGRGGGNSDDNNRTDSAAWDQPDTAYPSQAAACLQHGTSHPLLIHKAPPSLAPSSKQLVPFTSSHPWANGSGASGRTHWPVLDTTRGSAAAWNGLFRRFAVSMLEVLGGLHLWRGRRRGMRRRRTA